MTIAQNVGNPSREMNWSKVFARNVERKPSVANINSLVNLCNMKMRKFGKYGKMTETKHGISIFQDNGAKILGVAHLDAVGKTTPEISGNIIKCMQLDDRLGAWVLLELLPQLGCPAFDVLLTDNEERGDSTAQHFTPPSGRSYNWIFEFDRMGTDVVMYDYEDDESEKLLQEYGFQLGFGSFTDICHLDHLGCKAFNFGTGYHNQHRKECYADLNDTSEMAQRFVAFAQEQHDVLMPHDPSMVPARVRQPWWHYGYYSNAAAEMEEELCFNCGEYQERAWKYCPFCGTRIGY